MRRIDREAALYALIMVIAPIIMVLGLLVFVPNDKPTRCTEDMPCWNCLVDGNKICGPGVTP